MLERSELGDRAIATCLHDRYGLDGVEIKFLPLGNDSSAWVYRVSVPFGEDFFLKVRWGPLSEGGVLCRATSATAGSSRLSPRSQTM